MKKIKELYEKRENISESIRIKSQEINNEKEKMQLLYNNLFELYDKIRNIDSELFELGERLE